MESNSIRLSPKHGLNPSLMVCYYCGEEYGIALPGLLKHDTQAPRSCVWDMTPCPSCYGYMREGVILICVSKDSDPNDRNPWREGPWCVVSDAAIKRMVNEPLASQIVKSRFALVPLDAWEAMGLPTHTSACALA